MAVVVAALKEKAAGETRVAIAPDVAAMLTKKGFTVWIESGAGAGAHFSDASYKEAGATVVTAAKALKSADVILAVRRPSDAIVKKLSSGQVLLGLLDSRVDEKALLAAAKKGVVPLCLHRLPRTLSRAQSMDALSSQASIAGYRAAIVAADAYDRYFPMMITAAGTARPASVLVLGAGVAGLQAIGTARRLGAQVSAYDVRPSAAEEVTSLGATFLDVGVGDAAGEGGYARELTKAEAAEQQKKLEEKIAKFNVVITTAKVPGRKPPVLVTKNAVAAMQPGTVVVDIAASDLGGNVVGSKPDQTVTTKNGVTIIGAGSIESSAGAGASQAYSKNLANVLESLVTDGSLDLKEDDEVLDAIWVRAQKKGDAA